MQWHFAIKNIRLVHHRNDFISNISYRAKQYLKSLLKGNKLFEFDIHGNAPKTTIKKL